MDVNHMDDLDDIKYAVIDNEAGDYGFLGFFGNREHAEKFAAAISECPDGTPLEIVEREEGGFYIDIDVTTTSSFSR